MVIAVPATVEQLAHDAVHIPDPETALRALSALRLEVDQIEGELVARALHAGATGRGVGRARGAGGSDVERCRPRPGRQQAARPPQAPRAGANAPAHLARRRPQSPG